MRAELFPRPASLKFLAILPLLALAVSGCKTEKDPDQPTILGVPPAIAYLGVEYSYNFGAYGGESILDYSLTNAPSWLALEETSNKARQGIIMRGVPGLSGGARGEADLGKNTNINLVSTDGQMAGFVPFDVEVKHNVLSLEADTFKEGEASVIADSNRARCALPDLEAQGEHSFTINTYDEDGVGTGTQTLTRPTRPVIVRAMLDRPSVTRVAVAFELESDYDPSNCDVNINAPHQRCDHGRANTGDAIPGVDIVALGSGSESLEELPYLTYETDASGDYPGVYTRGVVTFEPGITECFIRLEVVDDRFAEPTELARLRLTEVRTGLAALGPNNGTISTNLVIDDNEPTVTLETVNGGARDTLNVGESQTYVARLTGDREGEIRARLGVSEDSTGRLTTDFKTSLANDELVFPEGTNELTFDLEVKPPGQGQDNYYNPSSNDRVILLGLDSLYQLGRDNYARAARENMLRVSINELQSPLEMNGAGGFVATDLAVGHEGKMFVAGYDSSDNNRVLVYIYDQKGQELQKLEVSAPGDQLSAPEPVIGLARRGVKNNNITSIRHELVVAYNADGPVEGTQAFGGVDVVTSLYWYEETGNSGAYAHTWTKRTGTTGDDRVRSAGINPGSGFVVIAGETSGTWPEQNASGGVDSFLQRIDTKPDGNAFVPFLAWTRQVGSSGDDQVAGAIAAGTAPLLFGSAQGSVNGEPVLGGEDAYFYAASSADSDINVYQRGTGANEQIASGVLKSGSLWLLGNGANSYTVKEDDEGNPELYSAVANSNSGFVLGYTTGGDLVNAFNLNDETDTADEQFKAVAGFYQGLIVAGSTDGDFTGDATASGSRYGVIARLSLLPDTEPDVFRNSWRYQMNAERSYIVALGNYRDDEIVALASVDGKWMLLLFSPEGELLTPLP